MFRAGPVFSSRTTDEVQAALAIDRAGTFAAFASAAGAGTSDATIVERLLKVELRCDVENVFLSRLERRRPELGG